MAKNYSLILLFLGLVIPSAAQVIHENFASPFQENHFREIYHSGDSSFHSSVKPFYKMEFKRDSILYPGLDLLNKHIFQEGEGRSYFGISPLMNASLSRFHRMGGAGFMAEATYGDKIGAALFLEAYQVQFMGYRDSLFQLERALPEYGFHEEGNPGRIDIRGYLAWKPFKFLTLEAGRDKHFIGDGYRSMLLSDFAPAFPYLKMVTRFWKISYTNLFTTFRGPSPDGLSFGHKFSAIHYLDWNVTRWFSFGLFEAVVYEPRSESGFDAQYLNPVILYRPLEYSVGSADNALLGSNLKITLGKKVVGYGQLLLDEFLLGQLKADMQHLRNPDDTSLVWGWWANKYGYQAGILLIDPVSIPGVRYSLRAEVNGARPFTYSHSHESQSYSHSGYALAHPLGANFRELVISGTFNRKRVFLQSRYVLADYGEDEGNFNFGRNVLKSYRTRASDFENFTTQGIYTRLSGFFMEAGYIIHEPTGLSLSAGFSARSLKNFYNNTSHPAIFVALRSRLLNSYTDR